MLSHLSSIEGFIILLDITIQDICKKSFQKKIITNDDTYFKT
jgi:hypothetical protein